MTASKWLPALSALLISTGCGSETPDAGGKPRVLATTTMIAEAAQRVGGDCVEVRGLLPVGGDPHVYEPVPQDARAIVQSDLVLYNGFGLEAWLDRLIRNAGGERPIIIVAEGLTPIFGQYGNGKDPDPHLWGDARNFTRYVDNIHRALMTVAPECTDVLQSNADEYKAELQALDGWVRERVGTIPPAQRQLVTSHDAFEYYARAYGLNVLGTPIGVSTDEEASAQTVARLVDRVRQERVPALFLETTVNPRVIQRIAAETGARIGGSLYSDSLGPPDSGADTYVGMLVHNTRVIVNALGGSAGPFEHGGTTYTGGV
ncbi:MAG: zinc ABC transporter substrate-binding protein [Gemmatimonadetes bacterium]|nr:zinc ABC transporter substrate-binding protein [Gemmatimonadota bacterium]